MFFHFLNVLITYRKLRRCESLIHRYLNGNISERKFLLSWVASNNKKHIFQHHRSSIFLWDNFLPIVEKVCFVVSLVASSVILSLVRTHLQSTVLEICCKIKKHFTSIILWNLDSVFLNFLHENFGSKSEKFEKFRGLKINMKNFYLVLS